MTDTNTTQTDPSLTTTSADLAAPGEVTTPSAPANVVDRAEFERVLNELHKHKKAAQALNEQLESSKLQKMREQNQWKEIAETKEREAAEMRLEKERLQNSFMGEKKFSALRQNAVALGLRPEALSDLEMLDLDGIQLETTSTGKINVLGADKFAERLKTLKPHWFADKQPLTVNAAGARTIDTGGVVTEAMLVQAERDGRKSGNLESYHSLFKKFQAQRGR